MVHSRISDKVHKQVSWYIWNNRMRMFSSITAICMAFLKYRFQHNLQNVNFWKWFTNLSQTRSGVFHDTTSQTKSARKDDLTYLAKLWFLSSRPMCSRVPLYITFSISFKLTKLAVVWFLSSMNSCMAGKITRLDKLFLACLALVWFFSSMGSNMMS